MSHILEYLLFLYLNPETVHFGMRTVVVASYFLDLLTKFNTSTFKKGIDLPLGRQYILLCSGEFLRIPANANGVSHWFYSIVYNLLYFLIT